MDRGAAADRAANTGGAAGRGAAAHPGSRRAQPQAGPPRAGPMEIEPIEASPIEAGRATLSVIIITLNEAGHIAECLDSVAFADEVVVVDSGSGDGTREIARTKGAKVVLTDDWPGFGPQKNRALELATCDWVLSIDADERVTPELAVEIREILRAPAPAPAAARCDAPALVPSATADSGGFATAYRIARLSNFGGRWIRHSGWWPDHVLRLFRRGTARFKDVAVHESVVTDLPVATLKAHFLHYPYASLEHFIAKINHYSSEAAAMMHARGKRTTVLGAWGHASWTFVRIYVLRRGFLDGREGFILAAMGAAGSFFRYTKLLFLNRKQPR